MRLRHCCRPRPRPAGPESSPSPVCLQAHMLMVAYAVKLDVVAPTLKLSPAEVDVSGAYSAAQPRTASPPAAREIDPHCSLHTLLRLHTACCERTVAACMLRTRRVC